MATDPTRPQHRKLTALFSLASPREFRRFWHFIPMGLVPGSTHELDAEVDLSGLLLIGELKDGALYALWPQAGQPLEDAPVVLVTTEGDAGVLAKDLGEFIALLAMLGPETPDIIYAWQDEISEDFDGTRLADLAPGARELAARVLAELHLSPQPPSQIVQRARERYPGFKVRKG